jgi:hypothetical protein
LKKCDTGGNFTWEKPNLQKQHWFWPFFGTKKYRTHGTFFRKTAKKYRTYGTSLAFSQQIWHIPQKYTGCTVLVAKFKKSCQQNPKPCDFEDFAKMYRTYGIFLQKANCKTGRPIAIGIFFRLPKSTGRSDKKWVPPFWSYP